MSELHPLVIDRLDVRFGGDRVLREVDLVAQPGRRIGLVGENGAGKSTLLRTIAGWPAIAPPGATVSGAVRFGAPPVLLAQDPPFSETDTIDRVLAAALAPLRRAVAAIEESAGRLDEESAASRYAELLEWAVAHDAWDAERRALLAVDQLGLGDLAGDRPIGSLSGGQRSRLALATLVTTRPATLLLDEPTNHLDDEAIGVLTDFLRGLPGVVLLASHDRVLLDDVCTDLVDLDPTPHPHGETAPGLRRFGGGWSAYSEHRAAERSRWEQTWHTQQEALRALRADTRIDTRAVAPGRGPRDSDGFIHAFKGANVERTVARRRRDADRRLAEAEATQLRKPPARLSFRPPPGLSRGSGRVLQARGLRVGDRLAVDRLDLDAGEQLLVSGPNGSGKSTLLGVLAGRIAPTSGQLWRTSGTVSELTQDIRFADESVTAEQAYREAVGGPGADETPLRDLGLLPPRAQRLPVAALSVGQRRRLGLAIAIAARPVVLMLDEPTNHVSLTLAGELEEAIGVTLPTVVIASHDRWLRRRWSAAELRVGE